MRIIKEKVKYDKTIDELDKKILSSSISNNSRFIIQNFIQKCDEYFLYQGIDKINFKWVDIYIKPKENNRQSIKRQKNPQGNIICPQILQSQEMQLQNTTFVYEVHERFGPSLDLMLRSIKVNVNDRQLLHLLLELIKLLEKINNQKLVCGELDLETIVFDSNPRKTELFLANSFKLEKKRAGKTVAPSTYCSRGVHLGRKVGIKDDLESICYILIQVYKDRQFLANLTINQCMALKITEQIQDFAKGLPSVFIDFYHYVISLNYDDEINFFYWKNHLGRILTPKIIFQPYGFLTSKRNGREQQQCESFNESQISELNDFSGEETTIKLVKISKLKRSLSMIK